MSAFAQLVACDLRLALRQRADAGSVVLCVFLTARPPTACQIHPARPEQCRTWPFWPELIDDPDKLEDAMRLCPGIEKLPDK